TTRRSTIHTSRRGVSRRLTFGIEASATSARSQIAMIEVLPVPVGRLTVDGKLCSRNLRKSDSCHGYGAWPVRDSNCSAKCRYRLGAAGLAMASVVTH